MVTDELVDKALELVAKGGGNYQYFFAQLNSPDWIKPLQRRGRFSHPPNAVLEKTSISFPRWPEGEYLVRVAPTAPKAVYDAIDAKCYDSDNQCVHETLLEIIAALPADLGAEIARREAEWASRQSHFYHLYDHKIAPAILSLTAGGQSNAAIALLRPLLRVEAAAESKKKSAGLLSTIGTPVGTIDPWNLQRLLTRVSKPLADGAPEDFLTLISEALNFVVAIHVKDRTDGEDYSLIWRPRIDSGRFGDLKDVVISGARDAAVFVVQGGRYETVLRVFSKYKWLIFRRLEYYALSQSESLPADLIDSLVSDQHLYDDQRSNPEFNDFLSKFSPTLAENTRARLLAIVDKGPDLERYSGFLNGQGEKRDQVERAIVDEWRLAWLTALRPVIGVERSGQLDVLLQKYGPPRPAVSFGGVHAVSLISAISTQELRQFSIPSLVQYLKNWAPSPANHPEAPSRGGLGNELQAWVGDDPEMFSNNLDQFQMLELHPTYLRSVIDGFAGALKGEKRFDAYKVAATIAWMLSSTQETGTEGYNWDEDPGWSWAHMSAARFLSELFLHPERLDTSRHYEFWPVLKLIAEDQSPSDRDEREYRKGPDFGLLALNSTRPVGLQALMRYVRWLKLSAKDLKTNATGLPDPFGLLAAHLDPEVDNSVAVREMYGMHFELLGWLDQKWWEKQLPRLFPESPDLRYLDRFAWNSYLRFSRPISAMLPATRFRYQRAVNALQTNTSEVSDEMRSLGGHLIHYYALGAIELDDNLMKSFFTNASSAHRRQTLGDVGWQLSQEGSGELDSASQKRLMDLWDYRLDEGKKHVNESKDELAGFGWWFASSKFPDDWSIERLVMVLEAFRVIDADFMVIQRLGKIAHRYPYQAVRSLGIMLEADREGWAIHGWSDNPRTVIEEALRSDERSQTEAERVVNLLVARGHLGFREFLKR